MPAENHVENPLEYVIERLSWTWSDVRRIVVAKPQAHVAEEPPQVLRIDARDIWGALRAGMADLGAVRDDVLFIAIFYPLAGLLLAALAFDYDLLPMVFPLASGFALLGPVAAVGLYEISRRRERGEPARWGAAFDVLRSPALGSILGLGSVLLVLFFLWLAAAYGIYVATLGAAPPDSLMGFEHTVFETSAGWTMIVSGVAVGFLFAVLAFMIGVISFPLLLDRDVGMATAVRTSFRAVAANREAMALWGVIVAGGLVLGSLPALAGLIFVMPVLGHATWHLYRKVVAQA